MGFMDLRDWMSSLDAEGGLHRIKAEVDWNLEISEILRQTINRRGPAVLFENIKGHQDTWCTKLFANGLGARERLALMFGMPKEASYDKMMQLMRKRLKEAVEPVEVKKGPVKENIIKQDEVDLYQIPVPLWHPLDGGRYINTWCSTVTRDPDTGELNVGTYRGMIVDQKKIATVLIATQDWGAHYAKYRQRGEPMPVAIVYGWDPSLVFVSGSPFVGNEYELIGAIRQEPVELVKCETSDLMVPASAEIVLEGTISPDPETYEMEGPFGEFPGHYGGWPRERPVIEVHGITHRNDPIFRGNLNCMHRGATSEVGICAYVAYTSALWHILDSQGLAAGVLDIVAAPTAIIKIQKSYEGQARHLAAALWGSKLTVNTLKTIVVVEEDVNIHDLREIQLAVHNLADPAKDYVVYPMNAGSPADPALSEEAQDEVKWGLGLQHKLLIDATIDWTTHPVREEWGNARKPPVCTDRPQEVVDKVQERWHEYGFDKY